MGWFIYHKYIVEATFMIAEKASDMIIEDSKS